MNKGILSEMGCFSFLYKRSRVHPVYVTTRIPYKRDWSLDYRIPRDRVRVPYKRDWVNEA